jgi:hypothetical protein
VVPSDIESVLGFAVFWMTASAAAVMRSRAKAVDCDLAGVR